VRARTSGHANLIRDEGNTDPRHDVEMLVKPSYKTQPRATPTSICPLPHQPAPGQPKRAGYPLPEGKNTEPAPRTPTAWGLQAVPPPAAKVAPEDRPEPGPGSRGQACLYSMLDYRCGPSSAGSTLLLIPVLPLVSTTRSTAGGDGGSMTFSFSPVFFALQSEIQNHRSKRGRLKSAKYYPYRSSRRKHHKAKCSDSKVQRTRGM